jgi:hypothetical protein
MKVFPGYDDMIPLSFGKTELGDIKVRAQPDDIAIRPGDTYVLKIHPGVVSAWKNLARVDWPRLQRSMYNFSTSVSGIELGMVEVRDMPFPMRHSPDFLTSGIEFSLSLGG